MKAYVITILDNPDSVKASEGCIESFKRNNPGLEIAQWEAKTPDKDDIYEIARAQSIPVSKFEEVYSRFDRCLAAFLSHYSIWDFVANHTKENTLIFEHDAYVTNKIPRIHFNSIITLACSMVIGRSLGNFSYSDCCLAGFHIYDVNYCVLRYGKVASLVFVLHLAGKSCFNYK